ncbi:MAG TPA: DUF309 domain-containing protein [Tepidisphaeraceae bacterium]|nr:DUF309 domain-containing protein [Tepidisphaeraceae bacterium]
MTKPRIEPMDPAMERKLYLDGIALFNAREFFEAHEVWEDAWRRAAGVKRELYQGLIQCAVALEHFRRSNPRGVLTLHESYQKHLCPLPDELMGLDLGGLLAAMHAALRPVIEASPVPEKGQIAFDAETAPTIALRYDPFETGEAARLDQQARGGEAT